MPSTYIVPTCTKHIQVIYEDDFLLVINKPEFLLSVPGRAPENKDCVITRLQLDFPSALTVHRLDLDTSGIMIIPTTKTAQSHIARQFQDRTIDKEYTAEVFGIVEQDRFQVSLPIAADWSNRPRQKICHTNGKQALTHYEVINRNIEKNKTRVLMKPITGRSHQLRIHSSETNHPILGCDLYAHDEALNQSDRLLLHASKITFQHPVSNIMMTVTSIPEF
jgi:tRNA pseudouridine32 synthase / 23S rRNA pseudouridine746 synthase